MSTTKKLLVRFDIAKKNPFPGDFLVPVHQEGKVVLRGIKSGKTGDFGMMVYVGAEIKENDLFAKLVDSGAFIENVEDILASLRTYVERLQAFTIGNVVTIIPTDGNKSGFGLELVSKTPS